MERELQRLLKPQSACIYSQEAFDFPRHSFMRGSPIFRTFFLVLGLALAAFGVRELTRPAAPAPLRETPEKAAAPDRIEIPFELTLSAPAREILIESSGDAQSLAPDRQVLTGTLFAEDDHPAIFVTIRWAEIDGSPRFAKLRLEPPGSATRTKIFDATGDLEDVWEPHLH